MPRPDLAALGVSYRRIPVLAIDSDVYLDTRLIMPKLESLFPDLPHLGLEANSRPESRALEHLLSIFTNDTGLFRSALRLLPTDLPLLRTDSFNRDRAEFLNGSDGADARPDSAAGARPAAEEEITRAMDFLEDVLLADGRRWILDDVHSTGSEAEIVDSGPSLADIEAIWPFHWLTGIPGALPRDRMGPERYPRVHAWVDRFQAAVKAAKGRTEGPRSVSGDEASDLILSGNFEAESIGVDEKDPIAMSEGLVAGSMVTLWPTDTGSSHKDSGKLVGLNKIETVIEVLGPKGKVRIHAPRRGFALCRLDAKPTSITSTKL